MNSSESSISLPLKDSIDVVSRTDTWEDCKKWYGEIQSGKYIFRGVSSSSECDLESTFDRAYKQNKQNTNNILKWKYEAVMLLNFKRIAHQYIEASHIPQEIDNLEWFSLLRHYGAPSRLLDFTYSFFNSVYFAIANAEVNNKNNPAIIWVIDLDWLRDQAYKLLKDKKIKRKIKSKIFQDPKVFNEIVMNFKNTKNFVIPINPFRYNRRIHLQKGIFLCPCNIENTFEENLVNVPEIDKNKILKIKLRNDQKKDIMKDLNQMNISYETLYGDMEGVARSLNDFFSLDYRLKTNEELLYRVMGLIKST